MVWGSGRPKTNCSALDGSVHVRRCAQNAVGNLDDG